MDNAFCVCIIFSRVGERIDGVLRSVFEQTYSGLRVFVLDNACPGFDHVRLVEVIRQYTVMKHVHVTIQRNNRSAKAAEVYNQCAEASYASNFTILFPEQIFANQDVLSLASIRLKREKLFYVLCNGGYIPFFEKDQGISFQIDPAIKSLRHAMSSLQSGETILVEENWFRIEELHLNYTCGLRLEKLINIYYLSKKDIHSFMRKVSWELEGIFTRFIKCQFDIPESERSYAIYLQEILEMIIETDENKMYVMLKENLKTLLLNAKNNSELKLKIVFLVQELFPWPFMQMFYDSCKEDKRFITQLVYVPFRHENDIFESIQVKNEEMEPFWETGFPFIPCTMYDISQESPDIAVFIKPNDFDTKQFYISDIDKVVRKCVFFKYGFEIDCTNIDYHFRYISEFDTEHLKKLFYISDI